eukprot:TRINITY_DN8909_c0_g1_i4.p4 TRINITY_DN8909_c0_g1~~TRINITY_DN8909_c0_g1_i4.p4  ORF type:complete len:118 (-),score=41.33 TRINITY_DN8909_c0_g1_i4:526-879(-)
MDAATWAVEAEATATTRTTATTTATQQQQQQQRSKQNRDQSDQEKSKRTDVAAVTSTATSRWKMFCIKRAKMSNDGNDDNNIEEETYKKHNINRCQNGDKAMINKVKERFDDACLEP